MAKRRINITLEDNVIEKIDTYAKNMDISRSAAIAILSNQAIEYSNAINAIPQVLSALEKTNKWQNITQSLFWHVVSKLDCLRGV